MLEINAWASIGINTVHMYVPVYTYITYVHIMISESHSFLSTVAIIITANKWDVIDVITDVMIVYWFRDTIIMFEQV